MPGEKPTLNATLRSVSQALQQGDSAEHVRRLLRRMPGAKPQVLDAIAKKGSIFDSLFVAPRPTKIDRITVVTKPDIFRAHIEKAMDAGNFPANMREQMIRSLESQKDFPDLIESLSRINVLRNTTSGSGDWSSGHMNVTPDLFDPNGMFQINKAKRASAELAKGRNNYLARIKNGNAADALIAHEMGHGVETVIGYDGLIESLTDMSRAAGIPEPRLVMDSRYGFTDLVDKEATLDNWGNNREVKTFLTNNLSVYGASNFREATAEMWSVYSLDRDDAPHWIRAYGDKATQIMRERGNNRKKDDTPVQTESTYGPVAAMDVINAHRRAALLINMVTRISRQDGQAMLDQFDKEETYARMHLEASHVRERAARVVAEAARQHGNLLGWKAVMDKRTSAECAMANGRNFDARIVPGILYPGAAHSSCRCRAVKPFDTPERVENIIPERTDWRAR